MSAENSVSGECRAVEAALAAHAQLREMVDTLGLAKGETEIVGSFTVGSDSIVWSAACSTCSGRMTVRHSYFNPEAEQNVQVSLPDECPLKPREEDAPTLYDIQVPEL